MTGELLQASPVGVVAPPGTLPPLENGDRLTRSELKPPTAYNRLGGYRTADAHGSAAADGTTLTKPMADVSAPPGVKPTVLSVLTAPSPLHHLTWNSLSLSHRSGVEHGALPLYLLRHLSGIRNIGARAPAAQPPWR
jgi:hypothetical protein